MKRGELNVTPPQVGGKTPNDDHIVTVSAAELPYYCPQPGHALWNSHPRVYIPLERPGDEARCIYCSTVFRLQDD